MREHREDKINLAILDFGSSAIKLAVAEKMAPGDELFRTVYLDSEPSEGAVQRGVVFNLSETSEKVRKLLSRAEADLGIEIAHVYASISGQGLHSLLIKQVEEYDAPHEITQADIERLWGKIDEPDGKFFLNADFARFSVNGSSVLRPVGVKAMKLQVSIQTVVTDRMVTDNVEEVLAHKLDLEVEPYLVGVVELSKRVLTAEQKRIGSALVDFGAETTTVAYFNHGVLESLRVIPMGGNQITYDLTDLDISPEEAERVKIAHASLSLDTSDKEELIVKAPDMRTDKRISRYNVNQYIEARTHEIVDNIKAIIARAKGSEGDYKVPGGMVITGGASKLAGLPEYLKEKFGGELSVKQVSPAFFSDGGNQELTANPEFHSLYAMLYVANVDVARTEEEPSVVEQHEEQREEPTIHIVEGEADIMSQPGVLPFDEEDLKPQAEPAPRVKPRRERTPKPKKEKSNKSSFMGRLKDLFAMSDDDSNFSDDED
nr:cell division protein FtsA [uncultured Porphyromonas sp.]